MAFFDPTRPGYLADPYPALAQLRSQEPVHRSANLDAWVVTTYAECAEILRDGDTFTTDPAQTEGARAEAILAHRARMPLGMAPSLGTTSGEAHRAIRQAVNRVFAPAAVRAARPAITLAARDLIDGLPRDRPVDFMEAFADQLPRQAILPFLGLSASSAEELRLALQVVEVARSSARTGPQVAAAAKASHSALTRAFESLGEGASPESSVLSSLLGSCDGTPGQAIDDVISIVAHIATVGADPTSGALGNSVAALATHPDVDAALRASPALLPRAVHEFLRYDTPSHIVSRFARQTTELRGRRIRRGETVLAVAGAANRDPAMFPDPDTLNPARDARRQLGFGQGAHICLGAPLALAILEIALAELLRAFTSVELVEPPCYGSSIELRIPDRMMVRFT